MAVDGEAGTLDPAFQAHSAPVQHWAVAIYDAWFPLQVISLTFEAARAKLQDAKGSLWCLVTGPATAVIATVRRIGWSFVNAHALCNDMGAHFDCMIDSPCSIAAAVCDGNGAERPQRRPRTRSKRSTAP